MYCLNPIIINNDLLFSIVLRKKGYCKQAESCSFDIIKLTKMNHQNEQNEPK